MRRFAHLAFLLCPLSAAAEEPWVALSGDEIRAVLTDRKLAYENTLQEFRNSGRT
jgi:hypothetical protein